MAIDFYRELCDWLRHEGGVAIATVVQVNGSVPREASAKMLVRPGGQTSGTIGGGAGEAKVLQAARHFLEIGKEEIDKTDSGDGIAQCPDRSRDDGDSQRSDSRRNADRASKGWVTIDLTGASHRDTQGICGGTMRVWVELWTANWGIELAEQVIQSLENQRAIALVTPLSPDSHPYVKSIDQVPASRPTDGDHFIEVLHPPPTLLVVGAGHVGVALARVAAIAGFSVYAYDDRAEMLNPNRFYSKVELLPGAIVHAMEHMRTVHEGYIALVTRGIAYDVEALNALDKIFPQAPIRYVGMMGSQKRVRHVLNLVRETRGKLHHVSQIHAPIGLAIGALTPEEIAISICAEMIQIRRRKNFS